MGITIVGAGLAGCEAAWQVARFGLKVTLIDMKPSEMSPAHSNKAFAELVCSNSLKADRITSACGLLKEEMRQIGSLCLEAADTCKVPAGGALAVDRDVFSEYITKKIRSSPFINIIEKKVDSIPDDEVVIIATGPLTAGGLSQDIREKLGFDELSFFDAAAPILSADSIDMNIVFRQSRYQRGGDDYLNCPFDAQQYQTFINELTKADSAELHAFENIGVFEGCMPIEIMASRGVDTLRFGPMKPVGLIDPKTGRRPYACVQLRQDNTSATLYSPVGFQTRLKFNEQKRVFRLIPGLENAEFIKYGVMHRNTYINSPKLLDSTLMVTNRPGLFFAGQITGVEGYVESMASGMYAGICVAQRFIGSVEIPGISPFTMIGSLLSYITNGSTREFQPMNANFGILPEIDVNKKMRKEDRYMLLAQRSLAEIRNFCDDLEIRLQK